METPNQRAHHDRWSLRRFLTQEAARSHISPNILSYTRCLIACFAIFLVTFVCPICMENIYQQYKEMALGNACFWQLTIMVPQAIFVVKNSSPSCLYIPSTIV